MTDLEGRIRAAAPDRRVQFLARAIHLCTIEARLPDNDIERLRRINEVVHRLSGHAMHVARSKELSVREMQWIMDALEPMGTRLIEVERLSPLGS